MRRGMTSTVVVTLLLAVGGLLLLVWSSSSGSSLVGAPQGTWGPPPIALPTPEEQAAVTVDPAEAAGEVPYERQYLRFVDSLYLLLVVIVCGSIFIVLRKMLDRERREGAHLSAPEQDELTALLEASGAEVRYRALTEGDPRNAVVACWVALEDAVYRSGLDHDPSRTASELTGTVLARWEVDPKAIRTLSAAYREARFSRHPVTEEQRRAAVDALEKIHHDLRRMAKAEQEAS